MAFIRLVGTVYFKKHASGFDSTSPEMHYHKFITADQTTNEQHKNWLNDIRRNIWHRIKFENENIPSIDALFLHWQRTCWISQMWLQADQTNIILEPMTDYGWSIIDNNLRVVWDSDKNRQAVRNRIENLLKGCKCKTGYISLRCKLM